MPIPQTLTDEQAAAIWSGNTASIFGLEDDNPIASDPITPKPVDEPKPDVPAAVATEPAEEKKGVLPSDKELDNLWIPEEDKDTDDDDDKPKEDPKTDSNKPDQAPATKGRKPSDLVTMVNQLVKDQVLDGFEDSEEIQTIEEAKELIKENLKHRETTSFDSQWKKKLESYSPQVQAILHYAEKGGQDLTPLIGAISEVETNSTINMDEQEGQEEVVRQVLKIKGFDDEEIKDQIETLKDLDKLKAKAEKFKPELDRMKEERIKLIMQEQEERDRQARDAARVYVETIQSTLDKDTVGDLKLKREDKFKIIGALAEAKHRSIGGYQVNEFIKTLEDLQFGKNANYEHFLNIVHFAVDRPGFINKIKESLKTEITIDTVRKLKSAKETSPNTIEEPSNDSNPKKGIKRDGFRNPYA